MSSLEYKAWVKTHRKVHAVLPKFREEIVVGSYVKVHYLEEGICRGRISYKGDIHAASGAERIVTIYFPDTQDFYDLNMWGNDGKMIVKYNPLPGEEFEIPPDPIYNPNPDQVEDAAGGGGEVGEEEVGEIGEIGEEGEEGEVGEVVETAEPEKKKKRRRRSNNWSNKKKKRRQSSE